MGKRETPVLMDWTRRLFPWLRQLHVANYGAVLVGLLMLAAMPSSQGVDQRADLPFAMGSLGPDHAELPTPVNPPATAAATPTATNPTAVRTTQGIRTVPTILEEGQRIVIGRNGPSAVAQERPSPSTRSDRYSVASLDLSPQEQFIAEVAPSAQASQRVTGVPASVTIAQAMLESDCGRSTLAKEAKNFFGIKATNEPGPAGVVYMNTKEYVQGRSVTTREPFKAYNTMEESLTDHGEYLRDNPRYAEAMKHSDDPRQFARLIHSAGYATDPQYAAKLIQLMDRYDLYQYDL